MANDGQMLVPDSAGGECGCATSTGACNAFSYIRTKAGAKV